MNLRDIGEFGFIERIRQGCLNRNHQVIKAIGDDAAVFRTSSGNHEVTLVTTDLLVERIHFLRHAASGFDLGYKALAVNLSDIAAMGGTAREAFVSIGVPKDCDVEFLDDVYKGMKHLAAEFDVNILGGDTTGSKTDLIINVCVIGTADEVKILYRDTAKVGDIIFSTGFLGDSRAGLHLILNDFSVDSEDLNQLYLSHVKPKPYLNEGQFLAQQNGVHAGIDVSDGLGSDLGHIISQSKAGAKLYAEKIPVSIPLLGFCEKNQFNAVEYAIEGGEDYTLLVTIDPNHAEQVAESYLQKFGTPLYQIGEITNTGKIELVMSDSRIKTIAEAGWDHFKKG